MGDVQVAFGILIWFVQCPSYLLWCTPPSSTFIESFISFNSSFLQMFGHLLGLGSFDSPKGPLALKQVSFSIISMVSNSYRIHHCPSGFFKELGPCYFNHNFMVEQHPFLFEALTQFDNNTFLLSLKGPKGLHLSILIIKKFRSHYERCKCPPS
jgi:hypothetical protein